MSTILTVLLFLQTNSSVILQLQQGAFFALSALFQVLKMPKTSKFFGTWAVDGGRVIRWAVNPKRGTELKFILSLFAKPKANLSLLVIAFCLGGCGERLQAESPTATEVAISAVNLTDTALASAIEARPNSDWLPSVTAIEAARDVINARGDICWALPEVSAVALAIDCKKCVDLTRVAQKALSCQ
jgi:hypothetical protein